MTMSDASALHTLGKYRLIAELGSGGMAEVYLAVAAGPAGFNKLLVVKCIRANLAEDPEFLSMFMDEARLAARLNHPNVVQTIEVGMADGRYFIAMEYLEGQPLNRIQNRLGSSLPVGEHLRILCEVLRGLHHAHELADYDGSPLEVVHRDMSPHNVFVTYEGQVKVVDFGIAKALDSTAETRAGILKGKIAYMSPEQACGVRVDRRADVYSVGVMMWAALVGRRMWKGESELVVMGHLLSPAASAPRPSAMGVTVAPELEAICLKALEHDRDRRYATALEMERAIEWALAALHLSGAVRDTGATVAQQFAEERQRIKGVIDAQLKSARFLPTGEYVKVAIPLLVDRSSSPGLDTGPSSPSHSGKMGLALPEAATSISPLPVLSGPQTGSGSLHSGTMAAVAKTAGAPGRKRALVIGLFAAAALVGGGAAVVMRAGGGGAAASGSSPRASEPQESSAAANAAASASAARTVSSAAGPASAAPPEADASSTSAAPPGSPHGVVRRPDGSRNPKPPATAQPRGNPGDPDMGF